MSNGAGSTIRNTDTRPRKTIASFDRYAEAQRAVDRLSDAGLPVDRVAIVGTGLKYVEQVTGRLTVGRAALRGAAQGATLGGLFGLVFGLVFTIDPSPVLLLLVLYGLVAGAIVGAVLGATFHALTGGRRDFSSLAGIQASRFEVQADDDVADRAADLLRSPRPARA
jgi:hypothetical protein